MSDVTIPITTFLLSSSLGLIPCVRALVLWGWRESTFFVSYIAVWTGLAALDLLLITGVLS